MRISTTRFGEIDVDPDTIITFPKGIPGFENCTRYKLLHEEGKPLIQWLQSLDDPDLSFSVADPSDFNIYFEFSLGDADAEAIGLNSVNDAAIFMLLYKPEHDLPADHVDPILIDGVRANASAPLVINMSNLIGTQIRLNAPKRQVIIREQQE